MTEFYGGISKEELYRIEQHHINNEYDKKLKNKSWFDSKDQINKERDQAHSKNRTRFYGSGGGGFVE